MPEGTWVSVDIAPLILNVCMHQMLYLSVTESLVPIEQEVGWAPVLALALWRRASHGYLVVYAVTIPSLLSWLL
jgi:hypothetical protein